MEFPLNFAATKFIVRMVTIVKVNIMALVPIATVLVVLTLSVGAAHAQPPTALELGECNDLYV